MYKVNVAICCGGTVHAETVTSLISALDTLRNKGVEAVVSIRIGGYKPLNCNALVRGAQEKGMTHIMFIDADMIFPSSGILRLLDSDKDIIGAAYNARGNPSSGDPKMSVVKLMDEKEDFISAPASSIPTELFKCGGLGLGFTLIKMPVFDKLEAPYFRDAETVDGEHNTEDIVFCRAARAAGFDVWCNPTIEMGHIGLTIY